jgi:hypothetical protein
MQPSAAFCSPLVADAVAAVTTVVAEKSIDAASAASWRARRPRCVSFDSSTSFSRRGFGGFALCGRCNIVVQIVRTKFRKLQKKNVLCLFLHNNDNSATVGIITLIICLTTTYIIGFACDTRTKRYRSAPSFSSQFLKNRSVLLLN